MTRLRFTVANLVNNTSALWEMGVDGTNPHPLLPGWNNPPIPQNNATVRIVFIVFS